MKIDYKGTKLEDTSSKKYKVLRVIRKEYGCLSNFLKDIELEIDGVRVQ